MARYDCAQEGCKRKTGARGQSCDACVTAANVRRPGADAYMEQDGPAPLGPGPDYAAAVGRDASGANPAGGLKFSIGKPRPSLFPVIVFWHIVLVLTFGAAKYTRDGVPGDNNWKLNSPLDYVEALERHVAEWKMGRDKDPESGYHPLAHAAVSLIFVLWFELTGRGVRPEQ